MFVPYLHTLHPLVDRRCSDNVKWQPGCQVMRQYVWYETVQLHCSHYKNRENPETPQK